MMNPLQIIGMIKNGGNPQQMVMNMLQNMGGNNPMMTNVLNMAQSGNTKQIEQFARNICKERGVSFDDEFAKFKKQCGI